VPGATTIGTEAFLRAIETERPVLLDVTPTGQAPPGAVVLRWQPFLGGSLDDEVQQRLRRRMLALTGGDLAQPVVVVGWNAEGWTPHNLVLRLVALGHTDVRWYRGGKEMWEVRGLPEAEAQVEEL
jgi:adenylate cyclase